jgi:hypothetical protein
LRPRGDEHGKLRDISEIPRHLAAALVGMEVVRENVTVGGNSQEWLHKIKASDKTKALELLARHLGMFHDKLDVAAQSMVCLSLRSSFRTINDLPQRPQFSESRSPGVSSDVSAR